MKKNKEESVPILPIGSQLTWDQILFLEEVIDENEQLLTLLGDENEK